MTVHPCPLCSLRFVSTAELAGHVQDDHPHDPTVPPGDERQETITAVRRDRSGKAHPGT